MTTKRAVSLRLSAVHACTFGAVGMMLPFWPAWLESRIPDPDIIGALLGSMMLIRVLLDPLIASAIDKRGERKRPMIAAQLLCALSYVLFLVSDELVFLFIMSILAGAAFAPVIPLGNVLTLDADRRYGLDYSRMRLWGSVCFIVVSMGGGYMLDVTGIDAVAWIIASLMVLGAMATWGLPDHRIDKPHQDGHAALTLLKMPTFVTFLIAIALVQASHGFYYGFATLHWRSVGYSDLVIGGFWSLGVLAEVALFMYAKNLKILKKPVLLLALGGIGGMVRWSILAVSDDAAVILSAQLLHALTFGASHLGAMYFLTRAIPEELATTAQSLNGALVMGGGLGITIWMSGPIYAAIGSQGFAVMTIFSLAGTLVCWLLARQWHGEQLDTPKDVGREAGT